MRRNSRNKNRVNLLETHGVVIEAWGVGVKSKVRKHRNKRRKEKYEELKFLRRAQGRLNSEI